MGRLYLHFAVGNGSGGYSVSQSCRSCALFDLEAVKGKDGRVLSHWSSRCNWVGPNNFSWPDSIMKQDRRIPKPHSVRANDGAECDCYVPRETTHANPLRETKK